MSNRFLLTLKRDNPEPDCMKNQRIISIVLAGGASQRMGQDKALLELDGIPFLTRICNLGLQFSHPVHVVSARDYSFILPDGCNQIYDRHLQGPLVAFAEALDTIESQSQTQSQTEYPTESQNKSQNKSQNNWYLLLSCDLPYLTELTLKQWIEQLSTVPENAIAYLAKNPQGYHEALCGFYRSSCRMSLAQAIEAGERSFQRWLRSQTVAELQWDDRQVFFNCNHPEDWAKVIHNSP
jgi:molybdenum cofactor guanylyltransferase